MVCAPVWRDNRRALARGLSTVQAHKSCSLACNTISSVDLAQYGVSLAKDWVSMECGTSFKYTDIIFLGDGSKPLLILSKTAQSTAALTKAKPVCEIL